MKTQSLLAVTLVGTLALIFHGSAKTSSQKAAEKDEAAELSKTGENHKLFAQLAGTWTYSGKHFSSTVEFKGRLVRKPIWEGRYFMAEATGEQLVMPWSEGREITVQDMAMEGFDNVKRKFVSAMIDNHFDTGILSFEGTYDPATKTISYVSETEDLPGVKSKYWKTLRFADANHYVEEFYTEDAGRRVKATEINYTRIRN